jgi:outer membrane protein OmpA-like peptidoglycan-associated protein
MTMQRHQDTNGSGRWLGLLGVSALALLAGCDWIGGSTPVGPPPRPGAEKAVQPSASLPPGPVNPQYDAGVVSGDDRAAPAIGSIIAPKGGQKAQREAIEKEQAERDRKDREARLEREAADKEEKAREKPEGTTPAAAPVGAPPVGAGTITSDQTPVSAPVAPPAPVTAAPVAPPSAAPAPIPTPTTPTPSGDPSRAFSPPPGWTPPGAPEGSVTTGAPPANPPSTPPAVAPLPAPTPPADPNKAFAPQPGWVPPGIDVGSVMPLAPLTVAFTPSADDACADPAPVKGNIAKAQSGEVPFSALKSPPFDGSLQVAVIQFGPSSTGLDGVDSVVLARVAEIQRENGGTVRIVAHAAQDRDNLDVSRRRALAIAQELRRLGVPTSQMVAEAASDGEPIYQTSTARGLAANRRVEVFMDF